MKAAWLRGTAPTATPEVLDTQLGLLSSSLLYRIMLICDMMGHFVVLEPIVLTRG